MTSEKIRVINLSLKLFMLWSHVLLVEEVIEINDCYYSVRIKEVLLRNSSSNVNDDKYVILLTIHVLYFNNNDS